MDIANRGLELLGKLVEGEGDATHFVGRFNRQTAGQVSVP
ncbi:hypothetical protein SDC9_203158 [bioreactor metagenome]|uniref:Uncharacterized protein n=1 Tax=bioreactor metagenome TaxID=1076179 RepID=A0A645IWA9_9ZZZZ